MRKINCLCCILAGWLFVFVPELSDAAAVNRIDRSDAGTQTTGVRGANTSSNNMQSSVGVSSVSSARPSAKSSSNSIVQRSGNVRNTTAVSNSPNVLPGRTAKISTKIGTAPISNVRTSRSATTARAAVSSDSVLMNSEYTTCRDTYFTCMDQFCAVRDETYRRCICSSRLDEIKEKERVLSQTQSQLQDFQDLNIDAISKTSGEIKATLNATAGEALSANTKDTSDSAKTLASVTSVLNSTKSNALSTTGKLDVAGDISQIWANSDLIGGADIATLTGDKLYEQVHSQCVALVEESCGSVATLNMVISAYGMYIENDCNTLATTLDNQTQTAKQTINNTERTMNLARLDNYDAHNSSSINDCIAQVRKDITSDSACGENYVKCLDITGLYLNSVTGEPIYTASFYKLGGSVSLDGDVLTNQQNRQLVSALNLKKSAAERGLNTCVDLSTEVWDEFLRQAIAEIYQGQQEKIKQVKNECISVVNQCYDTTKNQLKDFSNIDKQKLLNQTVETAEAMCETKLNTCANLYGSGDTGMQELVKFVYNSQTATISDNCFASLEEFAKELCTPQSFDTTHSYPYNCRMYAPGTHTYATIPDCAFVQEYSSTISSGNVSLNIDLPGYYCSAGKAGKIYTSCFEPYAFYDNSNSCITCPLNYSSACDGDSLDGYPNCKSCMGQSGRSCGNYANSLHQMLAKYARGICVRSSTASESDYVLPTDVLADVNMVMDTIKSKMSVVLRAECEDKYNGRWSDTPDTNATIQPDYKQKVLSHSDWGICYEITE